MTCTACAGEERICDATFVCSECGETKNLCRYRVGASDVCSECWERRELGPEWVRYWATKSRGEHGVSRRDLNELVRKVEAWRDRKAQDDREITQLERQFAKETAE